MQEYWHVAPFCEQAVGVVSGKCASRRVIWRGAQKENFKSVCITVTCALRRVYGVARQHQFLKKSKQFKMEQGSIRGSRV
ncbi:hypothetical protein A2U01_0052195 [Trifolium medium]|uniref:Uncharacterized protein n=1 Tax=Trifolium medium TaxID=97028 RepID=A0A392R4F2_9FABA|nr:hypothetical protein [Trifolium medium]